MWCWWYDIVGVCVGVLELESFSGLGLYLGGSDGELLCMLADLLEQGLIV